MPWLIREHDAFISDLVSLDVDAEAVRREIASRVNAPGGPRSSGGRYLRCDLWAYVLFGRLAAVCRIDDAAGTVTFRRVVKKIM